MKTGNERFKGSWAKGHALKEFRLQCKMIADRRDFENERVEEERK